MALDLRSEIFDLRQQGVSIRGIAAALGVSKAKVQRELEKRSNQVNGSAAPAAAAATQPEPVMERMVAMSASADPEIAERQRRIQVRRLELQESDLELRKLEQTQRLTILKGAANGGGGDQAGIAALLLAEVGRLRDELRDRGAAHGTQNLMDQLRMVKELGNTVASFAPPTPPSSPAEVEFKVALARINLEEQRIAKERENEISLRQRQVDSENMRNDAIAKFIENFGPALAGVAQKWLEDKATTPQAGPGPVVQIARTPTGSQAALEGFVHGFCPACGAEMESSERSAFKCPGCGTMLVNSEGAIVRATGQGGQQNGEASRAPLGPMPSVAS